MDVINLVSAKRSQFIDITAQVARLIPDKFNGLCCVYTPHTTAGITVNENADPAVRYDMISFLDRMFPWNDAAFKHAEGNSAAHLKSSFMGVSKSFIVVDGALKLGCWQGIYFCEFDGPRSRDVFVEFIAKK